MTRSRVDPIAQFMQDHDKLLAHLTDLNKAARSLDEKGLTKEALRRIVSVLEYLEEEVTVHNKSEEDALFPVLERYVEGPTKVMRDDHRHLRKEFNRLRRTVARIQHNRADGRTARDLSASSKTMVQLFVNHIHKENYILFPLVRKFLTKDALREIARRMV
jgi:hemerythrin-like domain-containing protein